MIDFLSYGEESVEKGDGGSMALSEVACRKA